MKISGLVLTFAWAIAISAAELPSSELSRPLPELVHAPLIDDYYPPVSRTLGEQGSVTLRLCYDVQGKVISSTVEQSSTFKRIDDAAVKMGRAYRVKPNVINGQPQSGCTLVPLEFFLEQPVTPANGGEGQSSTRPTLPPGPFTPKPLPPPPPPVRSLPRPADPPPARFIPLISKVTQDVGRH